MRTRTTLLLAAGLSAAGLMPAPRRAAAQIPDEFKNLQVLPSDISRDSLVLLMRSFTFATGIRCAGCHVMGENNSFQGAQFDLDDKANKRRARFMLQMVERLNSELVADLPDQGRTVMTVECKTCHRGLSKPYLLRTELLRVLDRGGIDAAVQRYRDLRERDGMSGAYDFGEGEMNELARQVDAAGNTEAAVAFLELNAEFHPDSPTIPASLGALYEKLGRKDEAIAAYRRVLELNPEDRRAQARLRELTGGGPPASTAPRGR